MIDETTDVSNREQVVKMIQDEEPRAIYTHCYGHSLNLACCDMVKHCKIMNDALDITLEITKIIKKSPKRDAMFERIKRSCLQKVQGSEYCALLGGPLKHRL